jgi:hypothetical protein
MKRASSIMVKDSDTKMSMRVIYFMYYMTIRACEVIDWWFPVKVKKEK